MSVKMTVFPSDKKQGPCDQVFAVEEAKKALNFHQGLNGYKPTPLCNLSALAEKLGISGLYVKEQAFWSECIQGPWRKLCPGPCHCGQAG